MRTPEPRENAFGLVAEPIAASMTTSRRCRWVLSCERVAVEDDAVEAVRPQRLSRRRYSNFEEANRSMPRNLMREVLRDLHDASPLLFTSRWVVPY